MGKCLSKLNKTVLFQFCLRLTLFWFGLLNKLWVTIQSLDSGPRGESNADRERQIQTQQTVIDTQPSTSQSHSNDEVPIAVRRQKQRVADRFAIQQHNREEQDGLKQQQIHKTVERQRQKQQEQQESHKQAQQKLKEHESQQKWFEEERLKKQKSQGLQQRQQLEQLHYDLKLREQTQNAIDRNDILVDHRQQDSEMGHVIRKNEQSQLYGQKVNKSDLHEQKLYGEGSVQSKHGETYGAQTKTGTDSLTNNSKTLMIENEIIIKDNQQDQSKGGKWNMQSELIEKSEENFIGPSSSDRDYYIAQLQEQQEKLQKLQILMQAQPQREVHLRSQQQRAQKGLQCNGKIRKEFQLLPKQRRQLQRRLDLYSDERDQNYIFDKKLVRIISESKMTEKQILVLRDSDDHHNLCCDNQNRGQYKPQNSMKEQPSKEPRFHVTYTEIGSTQTNPPKLQQSQSLHEFKPEGLAKIQNPEFDEINTILDRHDEETERIMLTHEEQLPPNYQIPYKNEIEVHKQGLNERGGYEEVEIGTEIKEIHKEHTQYNTDPLIDTNTPIMNDDVYQQYRPEIRKLYKYSKTFAPLINNFVGTASSDEHYFIEESLTRTLLELDRLPAENSQKLRLRRRKVIKYIYDLLEKLDYRVQSTQ